MKKFIYAVVIMVILCGNSQAATQFDFLLSQVRTSTTALTGGKVYFYSPGTTTAKSVWLDRNQATQAANPYTLDSNGTAQLYGTGSYRIVIKDSAGVTKYDRDNIVVSGEDGSIAAIDATSGNQTYNLPSGGTVIVCKTDTTANTVTIVPFSGTYLYLDPLSTQGECVTLSLVGNLWFSR